MDALIARESGLNITLNRIMGGLAVVLVVHRFSVICYRLFFSPLANFPGPKLAAATSWYEGIIDLWSNNFPDVLHQLHEEYGIS